MFAAEANPAFAPAGTCCALEPLFNNGARGRTKLLGDTSSGEDGIAGLVSSVRDIRSGVIEGAL